MSLLSMIKCEMCGNVHPLSEATGYKMPADWLMLLIGTAQEETGYDFCSKVCLFTWLTDQWHLGDPLPSPGPELAQSQLMENLETNRLELGTITFAKAATMVQEAARILRRQHTFPIADYCRCIAEWLKDMQRFQRMNLRDRIDAQDTHVPLFLRAVADLSFDEQQDEWDECNHECRVDRWAHPGQKEEVLARIQMLEQSIVQQL